MAIAYVQSTGACTGASSSTRALAFVSNVTSGNLLFSTCSWEDKTVTATATDTLGNTYSYTNYKDSTANNFRMRTCYAISSGSGANTITWTFSSPVSFRTQAVWELSGTDSSVATVLDSAATIFGGSDGGSGACDMGNITTSNASEFIISASHSFASSNTHSVSGNWANETYAQGADAVQSAGQLATTATAYTTSGVVMNGSTWIGTVVAFKPFSSGGFTAKFRKTRSHLGTGVGKRQVA